MQTRTLYGIMVVLIALLLLSSSLAIYYSYQNQQLASQKNTIQNELQNASSKYSTLASEYNSILSTYNGSISSFKALALTYSQASASFLSLSKEYNITFSLLVNALSEMNTSEPAYTNASKTLTSLWQEYTTLVAQYKQLSSSFQEILTNFNRENNATLLGNIQPISVSLLTSNILIDFGNGTYHWFNETAIQPGWNFYVATLVVTNGNVVATWYPQYSAHFVTGIDGVFNNNAQGEYWFLWTWNSTSSSWQVASVGADQLMMYNGSIYAWTYCLENITNYMPECTPH
jgi:cell division protein FtsL